MSCSTSSAASRSGVRRSSAITTSDSTAGLPARPRRRGPARPRHADPRRLRRLRRADLDACRTATAWTHERAIALLREESGSRSIRIASAPSNACSPASASARVDRSLGRVWRNRSVPPGGAARPEAAPSVGPIVRTTLTLPASLPRNGTIAPRRRSSIRQNPPN